MEGVEKLLDRVEALLAEHSDPSATRKEPLPLPPHKQS
jgi:hypothetical protein